ncbi:DoxX family protein [Daejeonella oryzae]|uniref:DoxX family protein n=1 Tax=Daejeonella oryzae TaxID=1122943 RepID=UPI000409A157|nr:MauE/DoxX family redox-associated membrane protein [Daejeonella oryzae]
MNLLLKMSWIILGCLFILAGLNHFRNPDTYLLLIPSYFPYPVFINIASGIIEIILGFSLLISKTRKFSAWGIIILLICFIPAHIYMIQKAPFEMGALQITVTIAWIRLVMQGFLILWAYVHTRNQVNC